MEKKEPVMVRFREAHQQDKEEILRIASHTWEGWDYVPLLLDNWLKEGGLFVAEAAGRIVGMTKTTTLSSGELWLEGLRVGEEYRHQGIGERLAKFQLEEALSRRPYSLGLSTGEINRTSIKIIERMGFRLLSTYARLLTKVRKPEGLPFPKTLTSVREVWDLVKTSEFLRFSHGLLPGNWVFYQAREEKIREFASSGRVWKGKGGVFILQPHRYDPQNSSEIIFFSPSKGKVLILLEEINLVAFQGGFKELSCFLPESYKEENFAEGGFKPESGFKYVLVYEYPLRT